MGGQPVLVSRTGWSAELGFEVYNMDAQVDGPALWDHLLAAGAEQGMRACGQMAMNIRRIEGGILNYRTDMDWHTTPYDMGLGAFVDLDSNDFIGRDALRNADRTSRFTGFRCDPRQIRHGATLRASEQAIGRVTAYEISPYLECGVGFALLDSAASLNCADVFIENRDGTVCPVEFVELPFYDVDKNIPRGLPSTDDIAD
jgi:aminomethyltransferase